jgi:hypothetical protein
MKNMTAVILLAIGAIAMVISYGTFSALGQSRQIAGGWQIQTSAAAAPVAWKINTDTGATYFCMAQHETCVLMKE